ncbi:dITP/XTP pyrophosphatase [Emticicia aquatica]|uniref:dITP/XTP pyrophosphatase n=1 Tax=Emticicia aquatica TaxID=1681835 RepID=A0ABN8EXS2_9BACT|nr:non-canonical purine NTP diphosphatase [Emticicia aquatica]CAH0996485.1 dITP/XTP pyrophosphatase [Emticicia aquatica]
MKLCLATNNAHKIEELQSLLGEKFQLQTLNEIGCFDDIPETADTFDGNSLQKAMYVWERFQIDCIADDSGLEVDALGGEPGVFSARYAGEHGNHENNMQKLLKNLEGVENRAAQFRSVITLIINGIAHHFEGIIRGKIIHEKRGSQGFGYDPLFIPEGYDRTFAEMSIIEKNPISHRGLAVAKMIAFLKEA